MAASFDLGEYYALNDAIFEHFFRPEYAERSITLALDDAEAAVIEDDIGLAHGDLSERLFAMIRTLARPIAGSKDRFVWWVERDARECVALLAASVLIMSRQGVAEDGGVDQYGYYTSYNNQVLHQRSNATPAGFEFQRILWRRLETYLNSELGGALGRIVFIKVLEYAHLNFPASQCLIRALDKRRLHNLFHRYCDPRKELSRQQFGEIVAASDAGLSRGFLRVARQVASQSDLAEEFWKIIVDEYIEWRDNPEEQAVTRETSSSAVHRVIMGEGHDTQRLPTRNAPPIPAGHSAANVTPISKPITRVESQSRLILANYQGSCAKLSLEGLVQGKDEVESSWSPIGDDLTAEDFRDGFRRESNGHVFRSGSRDVVYFGREGSQWVQLSRPPSDGTELCVLCVEEIADKMGDALSSHAVNIVPLMLVNLLSGLRGFEFTFLMSAHPLESDATFVGAPAPEYAPLELISGLRLRDGRFMAYGLPLVLVRDPDLIEAEIQLDGVVVGRATVGRPFTLPADCCSPGTHAVEALSRRKSFSIAASGDARPSDSSSLGYVISRHPAMMRTDPKAEERRIGELAMKNAAVLAGADLLLPYRRGRP